MSNYRKNIRVVARLDIKGQNLIKSVHLEGLRKMGVPNDFALKYYDQGVDELLCMDVVASLYGRNNLAEIIEAVTKNVFIPITVGGGIRSLEDAGKMLRAGADKIAINTAAVNNPKLISEVAEKFGSQCTVVSVEAKSNSVGSWEVLTDNGREKTGLNVLDWVQSAEKLGAGELLVTSVDREGTRKGYDKDLYKVIGEVTDLPLIASGGLGKPKHASELLVDSEVDAVAIADFLHYGRGDVSDIKKELNDFGVNIR